MKKILILVVSSHDHPYYKMIETSLKTWDSIEVENVETIFYCGKSNKSLTKKTIHFDLPETYENMGHKMISAFEWALNNKEFDYVVRVNSSCYVDKKQLVEYIEQLPADNVFSCIEVPASDSMYKWAWGGGQFILSKDVVRQVVNNKSYWNHGVMEDVALSNLVHQLQIPYSQGKASSLNEKDGRWLLISYGGESMEFSNFDDIKKLEHHFYRVKIDRDRSVDEYLMKQLYNILK